ncbi:hypothetical protein [Maridesulfovibrio zosterae]|uniref:hypothetical protein n=1 Tax=Maridesulfovibrio zosterae TaxID=82171 RepID=UPI000409861C|nr:hypothetical protein [Maridesulfovibrio zosterae]
MSNIMKYFTDSEHRRKRLYDRLGNYCEYIKNPEKLYYKHLAKKEAGRICNTSEMKRISNLVADYIGEGEKYKNLKRYIIMNLRRAYELRLHKRKNLDVFDIGSGAGFFSYLAKEFGHNPQCLDVPSIEIFDVLIKEFNVPRWETRIEPQKFISCNSDKKFDLIVAYAICFHKVNNYLWTEQDWDFFLNDLAKNFAKPGAQLHLWFNDEPHGDFEDAKSKILQTKFEIKISHKTIDIIF